LMIEGSQIDWGCHANVDELVIEEIKEFDRVIGKILDFAEKDGETLVVVTADHETGGFSLVGENQKGEPKGSFVTKYHTATMVPVFAYGPSSEMFAGVYENTEIHNKILEAIQIVE
ncbi:MAG: alkaline phosphatase, partial [Saprospiraceae bacterium]|nr:alkaline phosphatase [Saprospiraceae bacterium]